jgi:signal peptidase I
MMDVAGLWRLLRSEKHVVEGDSMLPSYPTGKRVLVSSPSSERGLAVIGDVIIVNAVGLIAVIDDFEGRCVARPLSGMIIKRVHAVRIERSQSTPAGSGVSYCVRGDNVVASADSRHFGLISAERIVGFIDARTPVPIDFSNYCSACGT